VIFACANPGIYLFTVLFFSNFCQNFTNLWKGNITWGISKKYEINRMYCIF
jgi:hypothetical protein